MSQDSVVRRTLDIGVEPDIIESIKPRHRMFADEWLTGAATGKQFNAVAAYEHAGYQGGGTNPSANANKLLRHAPVARYVAARLKESTLTAEEITYHLTQLARFRMGDVLELDNRQQVTINPLKVIEFKRYVKSFGYDSNGNPKIEFHNPVDAIDKLMRILGMTKEGLELTGPGGGPVTMQIQFVGPDGVVVSPDAQPQRGAEEAAIPDAMDAEFALMEASMDASEEE